MSYFNALTDRSALKHLKDSRNFLLLLLFFAVFPLLVSSSFIYAYQANQHLFADATPTAIALFHLAAIFAMAFALTPTTFIAILSGYFFSWYGLAGVVVAYPLAALLGLKMGRFANRFVLGPSFYRNEKIGVFLDRIRRDGFPMIVFARLSPILPFAMTNVALSVLKLNLFAFLAATMIGMFPRTFLFFLLGTEAPEIWAFVQNPTLGGLHRLLPVVLIVISTVGLLWVVKRAFGRMESRRAEENP